MSDVKFSDAAQHRFAAWMRGFHEPWHAVCEDYDMEDDSARRIGDRMRNAQPAIRPRRIQTAVV